MMQGIKCSDCNYCWNIEAQGNISDSLSAVASPWAMQSFDEIVADPK